MRNIGALFVSVLGAGLLSACVSMPPPAYQPSIEVTQTLMKSQGTTLHAGSFTAATGVEDKSLSVRGSSLEPGSSGSYSGYLREALVTELKASGRFSESGATRIDGVLLENELNGSGIKTGTAAVGARFTVQREGAVIYDKAHRADHQWDSSFIGAIAIPAAFDNYATAVQKLLKSLFGDPEFIEAVSTQ